MVRQGRIRGSHNHKEYVCIWLWLWVVPVTRGTRAHTLSAPLRLRGLGPQRPPATDTPRGRICPLVPAELAALCLGPSMTTPSGP